MANRNTLHRNTLPEFLQWLERRDCIMVPPKGAYEAARWTPDVPGPMPIIFDREGKDHLTLNAAAEPYAKSFFAERRYAKLVGEPLGNVIITGDAVYAGVDSDDASEIPNCIVVQFATQGDMAYALKHKRTTFTVFEGTPWESNAPAECATPDETTPEGAPDASTPPWSTKP